jgi:phosphoribosylaminoimidazole-succinocarboxamide synthase
MKILVVFGSTSDANVSSPLAEKLSAHAEVENIVLSAHRDLEALRRKILTWQGDLIVAGAGLAAALPGVVAAMTPLPVIGMPVASQFGGIDSFASVAQMPPGVPVLTAGPDNIDAIVTFAAALKNAAPAKMHIVAPSQAVLDHPELAAEIAKVKDTDITAGLAPDAARFNVYLTEKPEDVRADAFGLHVPFVPKSDIGAPEKYLSLLAMAKKGGLWVGANNLRNAAAAMKRLAASKTASLPPMLYEGSVKNVRGAAGVSPYIFEFSDRYSIFDWGQMPDLLDGKGAALAWMSDFFFRFLGDAKNWQDWKAPEAMAALPQMKTLQETGMKHHALGLLSGQPRCLSVQPVDVLRPDSQNAMGKLVWDYSAYAAKPQNTLVPLEVIFRFGVPEGSSLLQRTGDAAYCRDIGLDTAPKSGDMFDLPVIEFSTKLETSDRYLSYAEAQEIAALEAAEFEALRDLTRLAALRLRDLFAGIGVTLWDGKLEFAFDLCGADGLRGFQLVDSIGPDELRLTLDGVHLSKEALRNVYRGGHWYAQIDIAKKLAASRGDKDWKRICTDELNAAPAPLPADVKKQAEMIYTGIARALSLRYDGGKDFADAWDLRDVACGFKTLKKAAA